MSVVTFYSYKGGVGRSFLLANVGVLFARWGYRVLCVDWDLEAPGLQRYFADHLSQEQHEGLVELVTSFGGQSVRSDLELGEPVSLSQCSGNLSLLRAGLQDETYPRRVQRIGWRDLYETRDLGRYLEDLRQRWTDEFDFVLIDSRTGITDIGGICTVQLPDLLIFMFTANHQSLDGAIDIVQRAMEQRDNLPIDRPGLLTLPVPSRFDSREEYKRAQEWLRTFAERLAPFYRPWAHHKLAPDQLLDLLRVPYMSYWSFGEGLPVLEERMNDIDAVSYSITTVAAAIARNLENSEELVQNRHAFVERAEKAARSEFDAVLIAPRSGSPDLVRRLASALEKHGIRVWLDEEQIAPGELIEQAIEKAVRDAPAVIVAMGKGAEQSRFLQAELDLIQSYRSRRVIPVMLPGFDADQPLPGFLQKLQKVDLRDDLTEEGIDQIAWGITGIRPAKS